MLVYLFLSVCFYGVSQTSPKPVYYYDGNGDQIAKEECLNKSSRYKSLDDRYIALALEKDTCFRALLKKRKTI